MELQKLGKGVPEDENTQMKRYPSKKTQTKKLSKNFIRNKNIFSMSLFLTILLTI